MSRFYLESDVPQREQVKSDRALREEVNSMVKHSTFAGKLDPMTAGIEVVKTLAEPIRKEFQEAATKRGVLVAEEYVDSQGRVCRKFHGDSRSGLAPFAEGGARVKLAAVSFFEGRVYLKGKEPLAIKRAMLLRSRGLE